MRVICVYSYIVVRSPSLCSETSPLSFFQSSFLPPPFPAFLISSDGEALWILSSLLFLFLSPVQPLPPPIMFRLVSLCLRLSFSLSVSFSLPHSAGTRRGRGEGISRRYPSGLVCAFFSANLLPVQSRQRHHAVMYRCGTKRLSALSDNREVGYFVSLAFRNFPIAPECYPSDSSADSRCFDT